MLRAGAIHRRHAEAAGSANPATTTPAWPEKRAGRGWLKQRSTCVRLSRQAVEAAFAEADGDPSLCVWASAETDDLIIAAHPSKATFQHDPRWSGYLLLPQARMVVRFAPTYAQMEIRVRRRYTGVGFAVSFLAAAAFGVTRAIEGAVVHGPSALPVGLPFLVVGFAPTIGLWWRWRHIRREVALLQLAWAQLCSARAR